MIAISKTQTTQDAKETEHWHEEGTGNFRTIDDGEAGEPRQANRRYFWEGDEEREMKISKIEGDEPWSFSGEGKWE